MWKKKKQVEGKCVWDEIRRGKNKQPEVKS